MRIIPAIDIIDGNCVRLKQGDYQQQKIYANDPLEVAKTFEGAGIKYLHLVDLDGARSKSIKNHKILETIATKTNLKVDFGGGIKSDGDIKKAFDCGAIQVTCGSIAIQNPDLVMKWLSTYGSAKIILGADVRDRKIAVHGWQDQTDTDIAVLLERFIAAGLEYCICTDIATDGMLSGPSTSLYNDLQYQFQKLKFIASGGVGDIADIQHLKDINMDGAIIGTAIYENKISLSQLCEYVN